MFLPAHWDAYMIVWSELSADKYALQLRQSSRVVPRSLDVFECHVSIFSVHADTWRMPSLSALSKGSAGPLYCHNCLSPSLSVLAPLTSGELYWGVSCSNCERASATASDENFTAKTQLLSRSNSLRPLLSSANSIARRLLWESSVLQCPLSRFKPWWHTWAQTPQDEPWSLFEYVKLKRSVNM